MEQCWIRSRRLLTVAPELLPAERPPVSSSCDLHERLRGQRFPSRQAPERKRGHLRGHVERLSCVAYVSLAKCPQCRQQEELFTRLHPGREGSRSFDQGGDLPDIQLATEAKTQEPAALPPHLRRKAESSAVQYHCRADQKTRRATQFRTAGRKIEELYRMTLSVGLKERRQCQFDARISAAVGVRDAILRGWSGACGHISIDRWLAYRCCQKVNAEGPQWMESGH